MNWKVAASKLLLVLLIFAIGIGLIPMSNMPSMRTMRINTAMTFQAVVSQNDMQGGRTGNHGRSCCDAMSPLSMICAFLLPQSARLTVYGDGKQFSNSNPIVQLIYPESTAPPPKA